MKLRVAAIQMTSGDDVDRNLDDAEALVREAAASGATLVVLPEKWHFIHDDAATLAAAEDLDGRCLTAAREWATRGGVWIVAGSIVERIPEADRAFNTSVLIRPDGEISAVYRKLHLFDVEVGGRAYRESDGDRPGDRIVQGAVDGQALGMSICYDLRFPELYRRHAAEGATIIAVPAAFTAATGRDHWETLLRARAIENQTFVIAANQVGVHANGAASHGHSMIVDAWGTVLARTPDAPGVTLADLDFSALAAIRERLPALRHRRLDVYGEPSR